jgi:sugar lactone lactonase YvrE
MSAGSCGAFGPDGKLYVVEPFVGIIRMDLNPGNTQSIYAPFIPTGPSLLNDLAFDDDGSLYVTDSFAATIYRIPPGGGAPSVWFTDPRLAGDTLVPFGVNGIRIDKNNKNVYVSVTARAVPGRCDLPAAGQPDGGESGSFIAIRFSPRSPSQARMSRLGKSGKL